MLDFLTNADSNLATFWYIAIPTSLVFLIQSILTFAGANHDFDTGHGGDFGHDADGIFDFFSFRNLVNFLLGFSWAGILFYHNFENKWILIFVAFIVGVIFLTLFFYLLQQVKKLEENNSFRVSNVVGSEAEVYLRIPANHEGVGKILVSHGGSIHELNAKTKELTTIQTKEKVVIMAIDDDNVLLVNRI